MTDLDPAPRSSVARAGRISTRSVDEYLSTDFTDVERRLVRLRSMSQDALHTLVTFAHSHYRWPYEIRNEAPMHEQNQMSITTTTMILHAMAVALGEIEGSTLAPTVQTSQPLRSLESGDRQRIEDIAQGLRDQLLSPGGDGTDDRGPLTVSKTWGDDDPLTLAWLYEFGGSREFSSREWSPVQAKIRAIARLKIAEAVEDLDRPVLKGNLFESHGITAVPHPFPMLRLVQLHRMVPSDPGDIEGHGTSRLQAWFFDQVHRELSQSEIQDGEFDPAALVFSVEAILQLNKHAMRRSLLDRVMRVFLDGRNRATHWRPVRPLTVTAQGAVLLPQSIEVANSFLRICRLLDEGGSGDRLFAQSLESLCAYADWLETRCTRVRTADGGYYWGWQSEHTFAPDTVHMWVTSQVLLFLQHYASMLDRHRARESRVIATLNSPDDSSPAKERWDEAREHEPLLGLGDDHVYQIYGQVHKRFVEPRRNRERGARLAYSMVVHGPPGTGKTNFAKQLARALS